jgi:hypothetical protein
MAQALDGIPEMRVRQVGIPLVIRGDPHVRGVPAWLSGRLSPSGRGWQRCVPEIMEPEARDLGIRNKKAIRAKSLPLGQMALAHVVTIEDA